MTGGNYNWSMLNFDGHVVFCLDGKGGEDLLLRGERIFISGMRIDRLAKGASKGTYVDSMAGIAGSAGGSKW